ncbi:MAG: sensor domain-containing protein [Anaerolineales bacterium]|nr:sensor domain-containing protein [Anaerolineales bacterium]
MFNTIEEYLNALKMEMKNVDPALVQDAQSDAREHLTLALASAKEKEPERNDTDALAKIIQEYGLPEETAQAYREAERRISPALSQPVRPRSILGDFFGVYVDPRAWGALLYMFIAFITGVFYFTWAVTGASISISFLIFIFGFPLSLLFLLSIRGLALLEGRLVEALLGVRMPRRALFSHHDMKWLDRLKTLLVDRQTWMMLLYMLVQFVLGTVYFILIVLVLSFSLAFIAIPVFQEALNQGAMVIGDTRIFFPSWTYPLWAIGGFLLWTIFMNISRGIGQLHGKMAKWMLVGE